MSADFRAAGSSHVVGGGPGELVLFWAGFPVVGAGLAWLVTVAADWLVGLPWVPFRFVFRLLSELPDPQGTVGALAVGVVAGLALAGVATWERLIVTVTADRVVLRHKGHDEQASRAAVRAVFLDGRRLVLLGPVDEELVRLPCDLDRRRLREAFLAYGYPWSEQDPHRDRYRRWVPGLPDLPPGADALLRARQDALRHKRRDDARQLRQELAALGLVVRDEADRQYVRRTHATDR